MNRVKISIVVPFLGQEEEIKRTLDSLISQNLKEIEMICMDVSAKGESRDFIEELAQSDQRISRFFAKKRTCGYLLNQGIQKASGEYVAFLLPGDTVAPEMYSELAKISDEETLDFIQSDFSSAEGKLNEHSSCYGHVLNPEKEHVWIHFPWIVGNGLYRLEFLKRFGIRFNESEHAGMSFPGFLFQAYMRAGKVYLEERSFYHVGKTSKTKKKTDNLFQELESIGSILRRNKSLFQKFQGIYAKFCYLGIHKMLRELPVEEKKPFLEKASRLLLELHESGMIDYYDLAPEEHKELSRILFDTAGYYEDLMQGATPRISMEFMFPYHLFPPESCVVIYGAGNVGRLFYRQLVRDRYLHVAGIVDRNFGSMDAEDLPVQPVQEISHMDYDYVLIAIRGENTANAVRNDLQKMGVPDKKILWDGPSYFRDDFYQNLYFPVLREWKYGYGTHRKFVEDFGIRMRGAMHDFMFPYHLFPRDAKVVLCGAGEYGRSYYYQILEDGYLRLVGVVDEQPAARLDSGVPVMGLDALKQMEYEYILVAEKNEEEAKRIKNRLKDFGIDERLIRWDGDTYDRNGYFQNLYFPLLQDIGSGYTDRVQMVESLRKKLSMTVYDHIFPYHLFREGERIIIYGAGDVGKKFYQQAKAYGWVEVVAMVDRNAANIKIPGIPVAPVEAIRQFKFDKVLISMTREDYAREARQALLRIGIPGNCIKWDGLIYWREHFYRQYWFKYLGFMQGMRKSKI